MAEREVTSTTKGEAGEITGLGGAWGSRSRIQAVVDLQHEQHRYFVTGPDGEIDLFYVTDDNGKHLRTEADLSKPDLLQSLPDALTGSPAGANVVVSVPLGSWAQR